MVKPLKTKGFTLIELLVVIAIIGVLAGIILPSLSAARLKAHKTKIIAEFEQIKKAAYQYEIDNEALIGQFAGGPAGAVTTTQLNGYNDFVALLVAEGGIPAGPDPTFIQDTLGISTAYPQFLPSSASFYCDGAVDASYAIYFKEENGTDEFAEEFGYLLRASNDLPYVVSGDYFYCFFTPIENGR